MDHSRAQDKQENKGSVYRDESSEKRISDNTTAPFQDEQRPIRRVRSPSRPRAWMSNSYKPKFGGHFHWPRFSRDSHSFYKAGFSNQRYHHLKPRAFFHRRDYFPPKPPHSALREREMEWEKEEKEKKKEKEKEKDRQKEKEREKERYEQRENGDRSLPLNQKKISRSAFPRSSFSRDMQDMQFTVCKSDSNQSSEREHRVTKSKDRERSRDVELPLTASHMVARDRAIQQKRKEIDEVYYQECELFGLVAKLLIAKDPSLERSIQSSLQENLRDIGKRCVEAMEKFIEDYDSRWSLN